MLLYRITKAEYADKLVASGFRNRWNEDGEFVIYTSESRSLACLENLVHRSHSGNDILFRTMVIFVPDELPILHIQEQNLPKNWRECFCSACLKLGQKWYSENRYPLLTVPTSVIPNEYNYLLNAHHPSFKRIELVSTEDFLFDSRFG